MSRTIIPAEIAAPLFMPSSFKNRALIHETLRKIRSDYPLAVAEIDGFEPHWMIVKNSDVREVARRDDIFSSSQRPKTLAPKVAEELMRNYSGGHPWIFKSLVQMDAPEHTEYRKVTADAFMPQSVANFKPLVEQKADEYVDRFRQTGGNCDFVKEISNLYPLDVILTLMGVPQKDHSDMLKWTQWLFTWADPDLSRPGADTSNPEEQIETWNIVYNSFKDYYQPIVSDRQKNPQADISSLLANGKVSGHPMEERALYSYYIIASTAGHDTTAATTGTAMHILATQPEILAALRADNSLIPAFVEEAIRWTSPVQQFTRSATEDYQLRDKTIRAGDMVYISYLSANRDEDAFEDPFSFRLDRKPNRHVGFGYGQHICLGQHLARLEMINFWQKVIPVLKDVSLNGEAQWSEAEFVCGPKSLPISFQLSA